MRQESDAETSSKRSQDWMAYIDAEVVAVCLKNGWGHQIRRKWSTREKPVSSSTVDDYEWKLIPRGKPKTREAAPSKFDEGTYFVLGFDSYNRKFILQHDTNHCGLWGHHWLTNTYTEIAVPPEQWLIDRVMLEVTDRPPNMEPSGSPDQLPPEGWLQLILMDLTAKFQPNQFSIT